MNRLSENLIIIQSAFGTATVSAHRAYLRLKQESFLEKPIKDIISANIFSQRSISLIKGVVESRVTEKIFAESEKSGIRILNIEDGEYPEKLRNIPIPPLVLFVKGELPSFNETPTVCIVAPRKVSDFGRKAAYSIARRIAKAGVWVVSGGAKGGDRAAHLGALECGGKTVAVLPCGINYNYLQENRELRERISKNGCLISEFPPSAAVPKNAFQIRNRLLSGLSDVTLVVEAPIGSGTLITARCAVEQGRDLLVIPGNPTFKEYKASNELLRDGALPFIDTSDIFNLLINEYADKIDIAKAFEEQPKVKQCEKTVKKSAKGLSKSAEIVYNNLDKPKFCIDDLYATGLDGDELLSALTELEFEKLIRSLPGGNYSLI